MILLPYVRLDPQDREKLGSQSHQQFPAAEDWNGVSLDSNSNSFEARNFDGTSLEQRGSATDTGAPTVYCFGMISGLTELLSPAAPGGSVE